jgi:SAM-dependent methyltransferase
LLGYKLRGAEHFAAVQHANFERLRAPLELALGRPAKGLSMIEIGCGQWQALSRLFAAMGNDVIGLDPELPPAHLRGYLGFARTAGVERAAKTLANELVLRSRFETALAARSGLPTRTAWPMLVRRGAERLPAVDGRTDVIMSDNVFEHLPDVAGVVAEMARVLKPGGLAVIEIHPFTAFSGGHHPASIAHGDASAFVPTIPPWDHLRAHQHPSGVYLNGLRPSAYRAIFDHHFECLRWDAHREGERFLTPALEAELATRGYDRDEVLTGRIVYVGRKS